MLKKVIFLDRDGVINYDSPNYIKNCDEFIFLPGSIEAIKLLTDKEFDIILITNQSVINRGLTTPDELTNIFNMMQNKIEAAGGKIKDIFYCPHTPDENCSCRKPKPGLIKKAQSIYNIDLSTSFMVGDSVKDIECAQKAGCRYSILVKTGNGKKAQQALKDKGIEPTHIADNLYKAAQWINNYNHKI